MMEKILEASGAKNALYVGLTGMTVVTHLAPMPTSDG